MRPQSALAAFLLALAAGPALAASLKPRAVLDAIDYSYTNYVAAFSADGKTLATGGPPHSLKLWDVARGKLIADRGSGVNPDAPSVAALAFSPDGKTLAVGIDSGDRDAKNEVQLWEPKGDKPLRRLTGHRKAICAVLFSPKGDVLLSSSADETVRLWDPATGKLRLVLKGHPLGASELALTPGGKTLFCGTGAGDVLEWDVATGRLLRTLSGHKKCLRSVALSADGATLLTAGRDAVKVWDAKAGKVRATIRGEARHLAVLTPDGKHVLTAWEGGTLGVWRASDGELVRAHEHRHPHAHAFVLSPDGKTVAYVADNSRVLLWDVPSLVAPDR